MKTFSSIASSSLGNIIEWYDFGLFAIFSTLFSKIFFSPIDSHAALFDTITIFTIGFLCRPVGALLFGYYGDKFGRAKTLRLSILMITLPTILIGCLPTYQSVGLFAPFLLLLIRMWQGISIGGEYSGNIVYLAENAPKKHRALFTSFASMGSNVGILLAALVGLITNSFLSFDQLVNGYWRIPYLLSGFISLLIYYFRLQITETIIFNYLKRHSLIPKNPIRILFRREKASLFKTLGLVCMGSTFYYFTFVYLPILMTNNFVLSLNFVSVVMSSMLIIMILVTPMAALCCDYLGRKKMLYFNSLAILLLIVPGFYLLFKLNTIGIIFILIIFSILSASEQSTTPITIIENFPLPARYTGVALGYNLGNGFLGGTVPFIAAGLQTITNSTLAPAFYILFCALITLIVVTFFIPETKDKTLKQII